MLTADPQISASQLLRIFHHDEAYLFLGSAFTTVGLVAAAFPILRRKFDPLLFSFAVFAILYGQRLWLDSDLLGIVVPDHYLLSRLRFLANYLVPIPALFFFRSLGLLGKAANAIIYTITALLLSLVLGTLVFGPLQIFDNLNTALVIASLTVLIVSSLRADPGSRDFRTIRRGLFVFIAFALADNIANALGHHPNTEPIGFLIFIACLGYVAARRALQQEQQLSVIQKELDIAQRIQLSILPSAFPTSASFRVAARYVPMSAVAGDFYDFLLVDDHQAGLLIADVSGHGVPAALIASMVKLAATAQRAHLASPHELLSGMNAALCGNTQNQFVTAAYLYLNARSGELRYAAAAHPALLLLRQGNVTPITENGLMLAAFHFATYTTATQQLQPGDRLLLYTDGILEAAATNLEEFGPARLSNLLQQSGHLPPNEAADLILSSINQWSPTQDDDRTLLLCDFVPA